MWLLQFKICWKGSMKCSIWGYHSFEIVYWLMDNLSFWFLGKVSKIFGKWVRWSYSCTENFSYLTSHMRK